MSDSYYRQRAARRARALWIAGGVLASLLCLALTASAVLRDSCTGGFDRSPRSVAQSFVQALAQGDAQRVTSCWERSAYLELDEDCSEVCLSRLLGTPYQLVGVQLSQPQVAGRRGRIQAAVTVACPASGRQHTAQVTLDSIASNVPWRHWKIIHSDFGGPLSDPWCK